MKAKERHKNKLLEYLGNPDNDFPDRVCMNAAVLGFKGLRYIYQVFTPDELNIIEAEALEIRRKKYKPGLAKADKALIDKAAEGDVPAIKLCYQRFEDWSEKQRKEHTGKDGESLMNAPMLTTLLGVIEGIKGVEYVDSLKQALIKDAASDTK